MSLFDVDWAGGGALRGNNERDPSSFFDPSIGPAPDVTKNSGTIPV